MEHRRLGNTDMNVSVLGFGGAEIGYEGASPQTVTQLLQSALDAGLNVIDTAECYPGSEELIGNAVSHRRNDFYLFTKAGHPNGASAPEDWSEAGILASIERSLKRLRTGRLDLVQLHSCGLEVLQRGEATGALQKAREKGYTRYIGYSGDSEEAKYAVESGAFDTLQTSISIADQEALTLTLPPARERNMGVVAKRPIANAAWRTGARPADSYHHTYYDRLQALGYDFLRPGDPEAIATALRFTLFTPGVHTAIVGTTKPGRWSENAKMLAAGPLPGAQLKQLRERWNEIADESWVGQV